MALVTFKDLCIDANDVAAIEGFWSRALHLTGEVFADDGDAVLRGDDPAQTTWINLVPEARTVKNRVHLDLVAASLEPFAGLEQRSADGELPWTVFADPEGNEFCVFVHDDRPPGLKDVVVDAADHEAVSQWWAEVWGGTLTHEDGYSHLDDIPGAPVESFDFVPVPEPNPVKNRLHWDVTLREGVTVEDLVATGATVLATPTDETRWTVMADPEGNEFCVFDAR
ncbi:MAG: VOC family protein [Aeromicrobium sp.]